MTYACLISPAPSVYIIGCSEVNITMSGPVTITDNTAQFGGAMWTQAERLTLAADADISSNTATIEVRIGLYELETTSLTCLVSVLTCGKSKATVTIRLVSSILRYDVPGTQ